MKRKIAIISLSLLLISFAFAQEPKTEKIELSLRDSILKALEGNLDIKVQAFNPEISEVSINQAKEIFIPKLNLSYSNQNSNVVGSWGLEGTNYKRDLTNYTFYLSNKIITGGDFSLYYYNTTTDSTRKFNSINPTYNNQVELRFIQPLLKNFGPNINRYDIKRAQNQVDISILDLNNTINEKVFEVEQAYWNLVKAHENLKVRQLALDQSNRQMKNTREAVRIGTKSAIDLLNAETEVVRYEGQVISARTQLETYEDQLKALLNLPPDGTGSIKTIVPLDLPSLEKPTIRFEEALEVSLARNPKIVRIERELENSNLAIRYQRNQLLPQLDLDFRLSYWGQGGVKFLYQDDNALTNVIVGQEESSRWDAFKEILTGKYPDLRIQFRLTIPLESIFSRAGYARAKLEEEKNLVEKERQEKAVYYELLGIFKTLRNSEQEMTSTTRYREMMEKKVEVEEQRYRLGLVQSSEWLFQHQQSLADAKSREIQVLIQYKIAVSQLEKAMGISLEKKNLTYGNYEF
ncbi:MAG: TolC family protein [Candidatus Aminicenantaceae bacterium]